MNDKDKKGLWKFLLGLLKIVFRIGSRHLEKKLDEKKVKDFSSPPEKAHKRCFGEEEHNSPVD